MPLCGLGLTPLFPCILQLPRAKESLAADAEALKAQSVREARAAYEADGAVLRTLRMALREVVTRLLGDRRWRSFQEPPAPEEDPEFWERVSRVHCGCVNGWVGCVWVGREGGGKGG